MTQPNLPEGWAVTTMGEVATIVGGGTPKTSEPGNFEGGEIPWITPADLSGYEGKSISRGARNITARGLKNSSARLLPAGAVLLSTRAPIGYVAVASQPVATNQGFKSFVLADGLESGFVYHYLLSARQLLESLGGGTTFKELSGADAATIPLPLPPLPEQRRIVAEIETQFTRLDASVAALRRAQANLKRYRVSVLKDACEGRLVPTEAELARSEGRDYEPAAALLERILAERRARWESQEKRRGKYKEPSAPDTSALPQLPEGWVWASLDQLASVIRNGYSKKPQGDTGIPILRVSAVRPMKVNLEDIRWVDSKEDLSDFLIYPGDLLFTRYNGNPGLVGVCGVVPDGSRDTLHPDKLIRATLVQSETMPAFAQLVANVCISREFLSRRVRTTAGQSGISGADLKAMPVPLPPLPEQGRIVSEVERRLSVMQQAEATVEASLTRAERLRQSVLNQAFSGKLVPQDPDDEPASALLERIKAEREAEARALAVARVKAGQRGKRKAAA